MPLNAAPLRTLDPEVYSAVAAEHRDIWFANSDEAFSWWKTVTANGVGTIEVVE